MGTEFLVIHPDDNVAVALKALRAGHALGSIKAVNDIPQHHKIAIADIPEGEGVIKYGECIGVASGFIHAGEHVHSHNLIPEDVGAESFRTY